MGDTRVAFAERRTRFLKNFLYRNMEIYGHKNIHQLAQFVANLNSGRNWPINLILGNIRNSDFIKSLWSKPLREYTKPKNKKMKTGIATRVWFALQEWLHATVDTAYSLKYCNCFQNTFLTQCIRWTRGGCTWYFFSKTIDHNYLTMETFTKEVVSNSSAQPFPDNTLKCFIIYLPMRGNMENHGRLQIQNFRSFNIASSNERKFTFIDKSSQICPISFVLDRSIKFYHGFCWRH